MKLQRTPLILLLIALVLGSGAMIVELGRRPATETTDSQATPLFAFKENEVQTLTIEQGENRLVFEYKAANQNAPAAPSPTATPPANAPQAPAQVKVWRMVAPEDTLANDAAIAFLLNLLATGTAQTTLTATPEQLAEFGLKDPATVITVQLANQTTHRMALGQPNFNRTGLYAQIDPPDAPDGEQTIVLVSLDFANAVDRPLSEWQLPPTPAPAPE